MNDIIPKGTGEHTIFVPTPYKSVNSKELKAVEVDIDNYNLLTQFTWYVRPDNCVYTTCTLISQRLLHRLIMKPKQSETVDHINGDRLDNRRSNLRCVHNGDNCMNMSGKKSSKSKSKYKGVSWSEDRKKWVAQTMFNYKQIPLGRFHSEENAAKAYDKKMRELHGDLARYNFPLEGERSALI